MMGSFAIFGSQLMRRIYYSVFMRLSSLVNRLKRIHFVRKADLDGDAILGDCGLRQSNYLVDRRIEIKAIVLWRSFLDVIPDPVDDVSGSIGIAYDTAQGFPHFAQIWRLLVQK